MEPLHLLAGRAVVVMGVSGCGKSTVGSALAARLGATFLEGDDFHPASNIEKMASGKPLGDTDRMPWLDAIAVAIQRELSVGVVCSCSALRYVYRQQIRDRLRAPVMFLYLDGNRNTLETRLRLRSDHFMPASLLDSQLATLELPAGEVGIYHLSLDGSRRALGTEAVIAVNSWIEQNSDCI